MSAPINRSATVITPFPEDNDSSDLLCPIMFTLLEDAVLLRPCNHTISEFAANQLYHGMYTVNDKEITACQAPCPLCRCIVTAYHPNNIMRSRVQNIANRTLSIQPDEKKNIPFPGLGAKFVLMKGDDWSFQNGNGKVQNVRRLKFTSQIEGSIFTTMGVYGARNGDVSIFVRFDNHKEAIRDYFNWCGITTNPEDTKNGMYVSNRSSIKKLFEIIMQHNEIPADQIPLLRNLVISGDWRTVTPLTESESPA